MYKSFWQCRKKKNRIHSNMLSIGFLFVLLISLILTGNQRVAAQERSDQFRENQQQLNVDYKEHEPFESWARTKGHNWLVNKAFKFMKSNLSARLPKGLEEKYVHYGIGFADYPWFGLPGTFSREFPNGRRVKSVREDLWGTRPVPAKPSLEIKYNPKYDEGSKEGREKPNLYLNTRYVISYVFGAERPILAVDNAAHYAHDAELRADGSWGCTDIVAQGPRGVGPWMVKGDQYAIKLYELARRFWPNSVEIDPSLNELTKIQTPGRLSNTCGTGPNSHIEVPATYLGGNPFVLTRQGTATWPIWVPDEYAPEKLTQTNPPRSTRASAIYLGWALHLLHDLSHPYHAMNKSGPFHGCLENDLDDWIQAGKLEHLPVLTPLKGVPKYQYSNKTVYWPDFWHEFAIGPYDHCRKCSDMEMPHRFAEVIRAAKLSFEEIRSGCIHTLKNQLEMLKVKLNMPLPGLTLDQRRMLETEIRTVEVKIKEVEKKSLAASEYLMDVALKNTIMMIACLQREAGYTGHIKNKFHKPLDGATITFVSKDGKITKSTRSQGGGLYVVSLPKLGIYNVNVSIDNYVYRPSRIASLAKGGIYSYDIVLPGFPIK